MLRIYQTKAIEIATDGLRGGLCSVYIKPKLLESLMMVCAEGYAPYIQTRKIHRIEAIEIAADGLRGGLCSVYIKPKLLELLMMVCAEGYAPYIQTRKVHQTRRIGKHNEGFCVEISAPYLSSNAKEELGRLHNCNNKTLQVIAELFI